MSIPRPKGRVRHALENPGTYESSALIAPLLSLLPAAIRFWSEGNFGWAYFTGGGAAVQCLLGAGKTVATWRRGRRSSELHDLAGCLHTLHAILVADWKKQASHGLRLTIHVPVEGGRLQQVLDYIGDERVKGTSGRLFSAQSGTTGRAFREQAMFVAARKNDKHEAYVKELVADWNYTEDQARSRDPTTMSWLAIPLTNEQTKKVEGIVYADSTDRRFFTKRRITVALFASVGMGLFVTKRYGN